MFISGLIVGFVGMWVLVNFFGGRFLKKKAKRLQYASAVYSEISKRWVVRGDLAAVDAIISADKTKDPNRVKYVD